MTKTSEPLGRAEELLSRMRVGLPEGRIPARIFNDEEIYRLEQERVFSRCWSFLAHESEVPEPGDYVLRSIAGNSIIVARGEDGHIHAHLNMCRHRGNQVCKADFGNSSHFRCSYHGWTYANTGRLVGVPYQARVYDDHFHKEEWGLLPVRTDEYCGLIFGTLDEATSSLEEYLGGFQWYLDLYLRPSAAGTEVYAPPDTWEGETDWKICAENFSGDGYHTPVAHQFGFALGYFASTAKTHDDGYAAHIPGKGHGIGLGRTPGMPPFFGYPPEIVESMRQELSEGQLSVFAETRTAVGNIFPNLSFLIQPFSPVPGEPGVRFCTMRLWQPDGVGRIRMLSWCLVPKDAPQSYREEAYHAYTLAFGQAGMFEQDDFENWSHVTTQAASSLASTVDFPYLMGLEAKPLPDFPGPGFVVSPYVTETNFRNLWGTWLDYMETPPGASRSAAPRIVKLMAK